MKQTGIVRKLDELGRVVIPKEYRKELDIKEKDKIEIILKGKNVILAKHSTKTCKNCGIGIEEEDKFCRFCGSQVK